jgi:thiamine-monophosphate kinase
MAEKSSPSGEYKLLSEIQKALGPVGAPGGLWELTLGDDAAVRRSAPGHGCMVLTADIAVENVHFSVHFTKASMSFEEIGFRAMASNVSDCAAMAALPEAALVQLVFPENSVNLQKNIVALYRGFAEACRKWHVRIVGGDLSVGPVWTIGITLLGASRGRILRRTGVRPGDALWVSNFPGMSIAGFAALQKWGRREAYRDLVRAHIRPDPPVNLGLALGKCKKVHAMMDLSDGISKDARTLCYDNRLGLELSLDGLNVPESMVKLGRALNVSWQEWVLHGGEDYELLFAASKNFSRADVPGKAGQRLLKLGFFTDKHIDLVIRDNGIIKKVPKKGWDHLNLIKQERNNIKCQLLTK